MEQKLLEIIKEISALETENAEIKERLNHLAIDMDIYQIKRDYNIHGDDRLNATVIMNMCVIGIVAALCKSNNYSTWETNEIVALVLSLVGDIIFSSCLLHSYFKEKKNSQPQEIVDYSKLIRDLNEEMEILQNNQSSNLDRINSLNNKLLGFKEFIADLCVQKMAENNTECDQNIIEKSIGTYTERR